MTFRKKADGGFTLVELLVVIGIIALLIAILMPALSRARKQALQVSCGSNERQVSYAMLAYGNDWEEQLPTRWGQGRNIFTGAGFVGTTMLVRLPIIGFDSATIWDWATYAMATYFPDTLLGGAGFVMRDYLKNDFDIYVCPDGWWTKANMLGKWNGRTHVTWGPKNNNSQNDGEGLYSPRAGYQWLPHRAVTQLTADTIGRVCDTGAGVGPTMTDQPGDIAKSASGSPELLLLADYNLFGNRNSAICPSPTSNCGVAANHGGSEARALPVIGSNCIVQLTMPDLVREANPAHLPLGMNRSRIDARTKWLPFQDWDFFKWSPYFNFYSF